MKPIHILASGLVLACLVTIGCATEEDQSAPNNSDYDYRGLGYSSEYAPQRSGSVNLDSNVGISPERGSQELIQDVPPGD